MQPQTTTDAKQSALRRTRHNYVRFFFHFYIRSDDNILLWTSELWRYEERNDSVGAQQRHSSELKHSPATIIQNHTLRHKTRFTSFVNSRQWRQHFTITTTTTVYTMDKLCRSQERMRVCAHYAPNEFMVKTTKRMVFRSEHVSFSIRCDHTKTIQCVCLWKRWTGSGRMLRFVVKFIRINQLKLKTFMHRDKPTAYTVDQSIQSCNGASSDYVTCSMQAYWLAKALAHRWHS